MVPKTFQLAEVEQQKLRQILRDVEGSPYNASFDDFYSAVRTRERALPIRLRSVVKEFGIQLGAAGVMLIQGVPMDIPLRTTPTIPYAEVTDKVVGTEKYLLLLAGMLGKPIGFADWHKAERVQNLYPIPELQSVQCASNSVYLEMHTETAFRVSTPTFLALLCLKKDPRGEAKTVFCDLHAVIDSMDHWKQELLASPRFCFRMSGDGVSAERFTEPKAIRTMQNGKQRLHYAEALTAIDSASREVLLELKTCIKAGSIEVELEEGDLVLIDNFHIVHGRTAFSPRSDGTDRWLQRVLIGNADET